MRKRSRSFVGINRPHDWDSALIPITDWRRRIDTDRNRTFGDGVNNEGSTISKASYAGDEQRPCADFSRIVRDGLHRGIEFTRDRNAVHIGY